MCPLCLCIPALIPNGPGDLNLARSGIFLRAPQGPVASVGPLTATLALALVSLAHLSHIEANGVLGSMGLLKLVLYLLYVLGGQPLG